MITQVTMYRTGDGQDFETLAQAEAHENEQRHIAALAALLDEKTGVPGYDCERVARIICEHFVLTPKIKAA